jgi:cytochrome P450
MNTPIKQTEESKPPRSARGQRDLLLPEQAKGLNPFPWYHEMLETQPMFYDKENNLWQVFRYEDAQRILTDPATFSSEVPQRMLTEEEKRAQGGAFTILHLDPPRHRQLRTLVTQAFTPRMVARLEPRVRQIINGYLDKVSSAGRMDGVADLAYPLPVTVIAEMLGVPTEDQERFKHWSDMAVSPNREENNAGLKELGDYFKLVIEQRRKEPREDLLSELVAAQAEGEALSEDELLSFCVLLLVAGNETTTNLIGNAWICFDEHPEAVEALRADPTLIPGAIEEALRYRSPVQRLMRVATKETMLGGHRIQEGQFVTIWTGAANRDPAHFPDPGTFDIRRSPNRHLAFGHGIHFCVGAPLSRLEAKVAIEIMLERFQDIKIDRAQSLERIPAASAFFGVRALPMTFRSV